MGKRLFALGWTGSLLVACLSVCARAAQELTLPQALRSTEKASPELKAALSREAQARDTLGVLKSAYYPQFDLQAIDTYGFPGSSRELPVTGLMGSPYRSGPGIGVTSRLTLFDMSRGWSLQSARYTLRAVEEDARLLRLRLDQAAIQSFFEASRLRSQEMNAHGIALETSRVAKEVEHFVRIGQRSVVERLLVQDQTQAAAMAEAADHARSQVALRRLGLLTGLDPAQIGVPPLSGFSESSLGLGVSTENNNPLLERAAAQSQAAHAAVSQAAAGHYPKIVATASAGDDDRTRVVAKRYYSGGFAIDVPLFEGYRVRDEVRRAKAAADEKDNDTLSAKLQLDDLNAQYDEVIEGARVELQYLTPEADTARRALALAKERYGNFQGTLVDVREALRNLDRILAQITDTEANLYSALGAKAVLNGASSGA